MGIFDVLRAGRLGFCAQKIGKEAENFVKRLTIGEMRLNYNETEVYTTLVLS